jgi:pimeloyl-ACP methyl ester carboxylesterase
MFAKYCRTILEGQEMAASIGRVGDETFPQKCVCDFITVEGTRLRCLDAGAGSPVVLLHGNGSMIEDFACSGIMDMPGYRFIAFDRPGFGHSERPHDRVWGPFEQASLIMQALTRLGVERPILVGHSWGTLVAVAMALQRPDEIAGLVLLSGFFYSDPPPEVAVRTITFPFAHAVRRLMVPLTLTHLFSPCPVPERFMRNYPVLRALRTSHMRTIDEEAALLPQATNTLCRLYRQLRVPVHLIAGSRDRVVATEDHSLRLHRELRTSTFRSIRDCGHMVHHAAPDAVVGAIAMLDSGRVRERPARIQMQRAAAPVRDSLQLAA